MSAEDGVLRDLLKPGARTKALWPGALDLICPLQALDGGEAVTAGGLSAAAWSPIHFIDGPGCGAPFEYELGAAQVAGMRTLLIDDVMTTGATAEGCAQALKAAGAVRVDVAVVARVKEMSGLTI